MKTPLIVGVFGPTACRKSEFAMTLAQTNSLEIINCDSVQVYREIQIGANKPTSSERDRVRHHLVDFVKPMDTYTAGQYHRDFHQIVSGATSSLFLMVGGSGFYARAALKGLYPVEPSQPDRREALTTEWRQDAGKALFADLLERDPLYAKKIGFSDERRVVRALEILRFSDFKTMASLEAHLKSLPKGFREVKIALYRDREELKRFIRQRTEKMLGMGLIDEVEDLLKRGLRHWAPLRSVGYIEVVQFLEGNLSRENLLDEISKNTARLAKRQMTWLRGDPETHWFNCETQWKDAIQFVRSFVK